MKRRPRSHHISMASNGCCKLGSFVVLMSCFGFYSTFLIADMGRRAGSGGVGITREQPKHHRLLPPLSATQRPNEFAASVDTPSNSMQHSWRCRVVNLPPFSSYITLAIFSIRMAPDIIIILLLCCVTLST